MPGPLVYRVGLRPFRAHYPDGHDFPLEGLGLGGGAGAAMAPQREASRSSRVKPYLSATIWAPQNWLDSFTA